MKKTTLTFTFLSFLLLPSFVSAQEIALVDINIGSTSSSLVSSSTVSSSTTEAIVILKPFTLCSQEAIEKRDTDIAASRSAYNITMTNALNERKNREKAAIALEDGKDKKDAIKVSVDTYKDQTKDAQNTLTQTRKILWQNFENDIKKCRDTEDQSTPHQSAMLKTAKPSEKAEPAMMMRKVEEPEVKTITETIKETIKDKIDTFFSFFN